MSARRGRFRIIWIVLGPVLLFAMALLMVEIPSAYSARLGHGTPGTWVVTELRCGHSYDCVVHGNFSADDGTDVRLGVRL